MRKALIGILLAAGATMPAAAWARPNDSEVRVQRPAAERTQRVEQRQQRQETRQQVRQEVRQQRQETRQQVRQDAGRPRIQQPTERRHDAGRPAAVQGRGGWSGRGGDQSGRGWNRDRTPYTPGVEWQGDPNDPRMERARRHYEELERRNQREYGRDRRGDNRGGTWNRDDQRRGDWNGHRRWDRNGWRSDRRYNWQGWRNSNRYLYRNPGYYAPYRNYRYSRLSIGIVLDRLFWNQNYWIGDPWQYRLPDAGPGFTWVRYYNDVLLIDTYSGEVVDVIYDFFW